MNSKLFVVFATLFAVLCIQQTASEAVEVVDQPDELYILNPGSAFPYFVTDPNNPILNSDSRQFVRICVVSQCHAICRSFGFRLGSCTKQAVCVCVR